MSADCGDPPPPSDGYVELHTSTLEGARVNRVHVCQNGHKSSEEVACSSQGRWEIVNGSKCPAPHPGTTSYALTYQLTQYQSFLESTGPTNSINLLVPSSSLGSLLAIALLACGVLIAMVAVLVSISSRKKGL